ncbi:MAG: hypothetical protein HOW97_37305, partial [Catenulispora sp.]|nr:hypothetical protein [Catenulispora sp.]
SGGAAGQGITCAQGGSCSAGAFGTAAAIGAVQGLVTAGGTMALYGLLPDTVAGWALGAVPNFLGGAAGGASGYGVGCALGAECSVSGLATTTVTAGVLNSVLGAVANKLIINKITGLLRARTAQAVQDYDSGSAVLEPGEARQAMNPRTAGAARGNYIDRVVKDYAENHPFLSRYLYMAERFEPLPDFFSVSLKTWWDMTTPPEWEDHVNRYENEFGKGISLFTR